MKYLAAILVIAISMMVPVSGEPMNEHVSWTVSEESGSLSLTWKLTEAIPKQKWFRVLSSGLHALRQYDISHLSIVSRDKRVDLPISKRFDPQEQQKDWMFFVHNPFIAAGQAVEDLPAGSSIKAEGSFRKIIIAGNHVAFRIDVSDFWEGPWKPVSDWITIDTQPTNAVSLECYLRADGSLHVLYLDRFGNPAPSGKRTLKVYDLKGKELTTIKSDNRSALAIPADRIPADLERVMVKDDSGLEVLSTARPTALLDNNQVYFGECHFHTEFSGDGHRPVRESLDSARDLLGLDFASPADHWMFIGGRKMDDYLDILDEYNKPGAFVTLLTYELGTGQGHFNPYYRTRESAAKYADALKDFASDQQNRKPNGLNLEPFCKHFDPEELVCVPHHTNTTSGAVVNKDGYAFWRNFDWRGVDDRYVKAVEIIQMRGCFESEETDPNWHIISGGYGSSIRSALAKGLRFGFVAGTDNHSGWPVRNPMGPGYCALTGIQAQELTREKLFDALRARRTYATSGVRIVLDFVLNNQFPMGSEVKLNPRTKRTFSIKARGTAPIDRVEIISQGAVLEKLKTNGTPDLDLTWTDPRPDAPIDNCYYYVRIHQADGYCAWASPIWVDFEPVQVVSKE